MANKDKKPGHSGGDTLIAVLIALICGTSAFLVFLLGGSFIAQRLENSQAVDQPPAASQDVRTASPSNAPSSAPSSVPSPEPVLESDNPEEPSEEPSNEPDPEPAQTAEPVQESEPPAAEPSQAPAQTQAPASTPTPTRTPTAPTTPSQNPAPAVSIQPVQNTTAPIQSGNAGTTLNSNGTYTHDFSGGHVLGTVNSDKYHTYDCSAAKKIPPENEVWYDSAADARADGRDLCGICGK